MTTPAAAHQPPFALDGSVTGEKLQELLDVQTELAWLDFKRECDLNSTPELVELAKDVGAMGIAGGYLVVGADSQGVLLGLRAGQERLFDEATLAAKLARYLAPGFQVRSAVHQLPDASGAEVPVALVWIAPHLAGCSMFIKNGEYEVNGKRRVAFHKGQVYARHGTSSEPATPADLAAATAGVVARQKEDWRAEHAEDLRHAVEAAVRGGSPAAAAYTWQVNAATFAADTVAALRRDDDVPVRQVLRAASAEAQRLVRMGGDADTADLGVVLDRITTVAALGLELQRPAVRTLAVRTLLDLYGWGVSALEVQTSRHPLVPVLWLRVAERLYALGGLAVRLRDWAAVRELALSPVPALEAESPGRTWHRDALTQASRARLFVEQLPGGRARELSLLMFARAVAAADPALRPDLPGDVAAEPSSGDPLLASLCQFDLLLTVVAGVTAGAGDTRALLAVSYPNYARFDSRRSTGVLRPLVEDRQVRHALLPDVTDRQLAQVLHLADQVAEREGRRFYGWDGYQDDIVQGFLDQHRD